MYCWKLAEKGKFELFANDISVMSAYAKAAHIDGRKVDTLTAQLVNSIETAKGYELVYQAENGLILTEKLSLENDTPIASCTLSDASGADVETNYLVPMVISSDLKGELPLWKSLWTRMLTVPYDNTMWLRLKPSPCAQAA